MKVRLPDKDTTGIDNTRTDYIELRMLIAIEAMKGFLSSWGEHDLQNFSEIAHDSFLLADSMIKQSKQTKR